jgi:hypothetical protein
MEFGWLPSNVTIKCHALVVANRKAFGGSLPKLLWQRDTMVFVAMHPDLLTLLGSATAARKICLLFGVAEHRENRNCYESNEFLVFVDGNKTGTTTRGGFLFRK